MDDCYGCKIEYETDVPTILLETRTIPYKFQFENVKLLVMLFNLLKFFKSANYWLLKKLEWSASMNSTILQNKMVTKKTWSYLNFCSDPIHSTQALIFYLLTF